MKAKKSLSLFLSAACALAMAWTMAQAADQSGVFEPASLYPPQNKLIASPGNTVYYVDPVRGDDARTGRAENMAWKSIARVNALKLAPGDRVVIYPGVHGVTLKPSGAGTVECPVIIEFKPGVHEFAVQEALRRHYYVAAACDDPTKPKPIGLLFENVRHLRIKGGGVSGADKTEILYGGRMVEIINDHAEDISFSNLVFDLKRPTVSEFRVLSAEPDSAVIQIAEGSDYAIENGKFTWTGDIGSGGLLVQEAVPEEGRCWRRDPWNGFETAMKTEDLGGAQGSTDLEGGQSRPATGASIPFSFYNPGLCGGV